MSDKKNPDPISRLKTTFSALKGIAHILKTNRDNDYLSFPLPDGAEEAMAAIYALKKAGFLSNCGLVLYIRAYEKHFGVNITPEKIEKIKSLTGVPLITKQQYTAAVALLNPDAAATPEWNTKKVGRSK